MTVSVQTPFIEYIGNGVTTVYPYTFRLLDDVDIIVEIDGVEQLSGFTLSGIGDSGGGNVTFDVAPANLSQVLIKRILPLTRSIDYQEGGELPADTLNLDIDRLWQALQQVSQYFKTALKLPFNTTTDQVVTDEADEREGKVVSFDSSGNMILTNLVTGIANVSSFMLTVLVAANAAAARALLGTTTAAQKQTETAFTSSGTSPNYTVTTSPAYGAYTQFERLFLKIHSSAITGAAVSLNRDALGAKNIYQKDATGAKINPFLPSNFTADIEYDGVDYVILNPLPPKKLIVAVRQTIFSGPVDSNGLPNFGGSTGSSSVTASGTLIATAANGFSANDGLVDLIGSVTNPSWTGLSTNGTMYLYIDIASNGSCTTGSTTLAPIYRWGGSDVTTNNQFTFNIQEMVGKVGNGSVANQTYRVFVGEVTVSGSVVTAITWYALMGRYLGAWTSTLPGTSTTTTATHNIGVSNITSSQQVKPTFAFEIECTSADAGAAVGDLMRNPLTLNTGSVTGKLEPVTSGNTTYIKTGSVVAFGITNAGANVGLTSASWKYRFVGNRGW